MAAPQPVEPAPEWDAQPEEFAPPTAPPRTPSSDAHDYYNAPPPAAPPPNFGRQPFGGAPLAAGAEHFQAEHDVPGYPALHASQTTVAGYEDDAYRPGAPQLGPEQDDFYDDVQPSRRRMGIVVIAGVFALAVIGTAGAFGYRAMFGSSAASVAAAGDQSGYGAEQDRAGPAKDAAVEQADHRSRQRRGQGEKLVSREEKPVDVDSRARPAPEWRKTPQLPTAAASSAPSRRRSAPSPSVPIRRLRPSRRPRLRPPRPRRRRG